MSDARNKARFKSTLAGLLASFAPGADPSNRPEFIGAAFRDVLEHTTRKYLIDEILIALGWDLGRLTQQIVEEARGKGETTLFLDYLGVNPESRIPAAIFEAKALGKPFVGPSEVGAALAGQPLELIATAITHVKNRRDPATSPITQEWTVWLSKLYDYVTAIHRESGHVVQRVAITSGRWLVIFTDPQRLFVAPEDANFADILIYEFGELVECSDEIFDHLAQQHLLDDSRPFIERSELQSYVDGPNVTRLYHGLWVARLRDGAAFDSFPQVNLYPVVIVERRDGTFLTVVHHPRARIPIPHQYEALVPHIDSVRQSADALLADVNAELGIHLPASPLTDFPGFRGPSAPSRYLKSFPRWPDNYLLATGTDRHFLLNEPSVDPCTGHDWAECHSVQENQGDAAIVDRSYDLASFFTSEEPHHCAHRTVHGRRNARCHIDPFEEFLCCRSCIFQSLCWNQAELAALPCGMQAAANPALQVQATAPAE